jgi:hypothetical protein
MVSTATADVSGAVPPMLGEPAEGPLCTHHHGGTVTPPSMTTARNLIADEEWSAVFMSIGTAIADHPQIVAKFSAEEVRTLEIFLTALVERLDLRDAETTGVH